MPEPAQLRGYPLLRLGVEGNGKLKQKCQRGSEFRCAPAVPAFVGRLVRPAPAVADEPPRNGKLLPVKRAGASTAEVRGSNPLRSTTKSAQTHVISYATG